jgi:S-(hydroxymethyl)glutathione dehydrogenase/alcohol dehydrogenase
MRAAVLYEYDSPLRLEDVSIDKPMPTEVLVRVAAAGLCHSEIGAIRREIPIVSFPSVLGHESAGVVEAVGEDVTYAKPGDHVITVPMSGIFCGTCEYCLTGQVALCAREGVRRDPAGRPRLSLRGQPVDQFSELGSFAEYVLVHENAVVKVPHEMPLDRAALVGCAVKTGLGAVFNAAKLEPGSTAAVIGCGGVGLNVIQGARIAGALRIIAIDKEPSRLELARVLGATDTLDARDGDVTERVLELTSGGVDHSFEVVGLADTVTQAFSMLRKGGTTTVVGVVFGLDLVISGTLLMAGERRIQGCLGGSSRSRIDLPRYVDYYLQGRLILDELITSRIALEEVNEGLAALERHEGARSVIMFEAA